MKSFNEYRSENTENNIDQNQENKFQLFLEYIEEHKERESKGLEFLTESENQELNDWLAVFEQEYNADIKNIDEGFIGRLVGGAAGFLVGPTIGKIIARALGVEKGILYDLFTSRLVSAALGSAIAKSFEANKK